MKTINSKSYPFILILLAFTSSTFSQKQSRESINVEFSSRTASKPQYAQHFATGPYNKPCFSYRAQSKFIYLSSLESLLPGVIYFKLHNPIVRAGTKFNCKIDWISWIIRNESDVVLKYRFRVGGYDGEWSYWKFIHQNTEITIGQFDPGRYPRIDFEIKYQSGTWLWGSARVRVNGEMGICIE